MMTIERKSFVAAAILALLWSAAMGLAQSTNYTVLKHFAGTNGANPWCALVCSGGWLYGTTYSGGTSGYGTVFRVSTNGDNFSVLKNFHDTDGANPKTGMVLSGSTLYGTTLVGGNSTFSTVFKVNTDGSGFSVLKKTTLQSDGSSPEGGPLLSGSTLFGTMSYSGNSNDGTVFKIRTDGMGYTVVNAFDCVFHSGGGGHYSGGAYPRAGLAMSGSVLYGTTEQCGSSNAGTIFRLNTNGSGFTELKSFTGSDGVNPMSPPLLSGTILYGTALAGGSSHYGTVFKMNTDGSGFTVLKHFTGTDGRNPRGSLVLSGNTIFGTTQQGGNSSNGTIFRINIDGSGFSVIKHFAGSEGSGPQGGLTKSGNTLYGTTRTGGNSGYGTVFKLDLPPDSAPRLTAARVGTSFIVSWPSSSAGYSLEENTNLSGTNWTTVGTLPADDGTNKSLTILPLSASKFYRLKQ